MVCCRFSRVHGLIICRVRTLLLIDTLFVVVYLVNVIKRYLFFFNDSRSAGSITIVPFCLGNKSTTFVHIKMNSDNMTTHSMVYAKKEA